MKDIIRRLIPLILVVGLLVFLQSWGFSIFGIKPNLALISIIATSFFTIDLLEGLLLVLLAALILKFSPGFEKEILFFSLIGLGAIIIKNYLPWHYYLNNIFLIILGTFIFYLLLAHNLILSSVFLKEVLLNLIFGIVLFVFLNGLVEKSKPKM